MLVSSSRSRISKLHALQSLGDLAIYASAPFCQYYLRDTLQILKQAGEVSLTAGGAKDDEELENYLNDLKTNVLNCYSTVTSGTKVANMQAVLLEFTP